MPFLNQLAGSIPSRVLEGLNRFFPTLKYKMFTLLRDIREGFAFNKKDSAENEGRKCNYPDGFHIMNI